MTAAEIKPEHWLKQFPDLRAMLDREGFELKEHMWNAMRQFATAQTQEKDKEIKEFRDMLQKVVHDVKDWHDYNVNQIDSFDGNEMELQERKAEEIGQRYIALMLLLKRAENNNHEINHQSKTQDYEKNR